MSRRQSMKRPELSLPPGTDWHPKSLQKGIVRCVNLEAEACLVTPSFGIAEPLQCWIRDPVPGRAAEQTGEMAARPRTEFAGAIGYLATLLFHQVRPRKRSAAQEKRNSCCGPQPDLALGLAPEIKSQFSQRYERPDATIPVGSPNPMPAPMEALFAELASRRLRSLATKKRV